MSDIKFKIIKCFGVLSVNEKGWSKELNLVSWNDAEPKYDLRQWSPDHEKMGKGIGLSAEELRKLSELIAGMDAPAPVPKKSVPRETAADASQKPVRKAAAPKAKVPEPIAKLDNGLVSYEARRLTPHAQSELGRLTTGLGRGATGTIDVNVFVACALVGLLNALDERRYLEYCRDLANSIMFRLTYDDDRALYNSMEELFRGALLRNGFTDNDADGAAREMHTRYFLQLIDTAERAAEKERYPRNIPAVGEDDINTVDMATVFARLPDRPGIGQTFKALGVDPCREQQRMVGWFAQQITLGTGSSARAVPNHSAKTTYNKLSSPTSLLWIAAALGEDPSALRETYQDMRSKGTGAGKCAILRKHIPFSRIKELAGKFI